MGQEEYYAGGQEHYFGGGGDTLIHPAVAVLLGLVVLLVLFVRRKYIIYPFMLFAILIPFTQVVVVGGLHFQVIRILILVAWLRLVIIRFLTRSDPAIIPLNRTDKVFSLWVLSNAVMFTILWGQWGALVNRLGFLYTYLGIYFLMRFLIRDNDDVERTIKVLAFVSILCGVLMVNEQWTGRNVFAILGGMSENVMVRAGRLRSQACFLHPLLAGALGATFVSLFIGLGWKNRKARKTAMMGALGSVLMAITSGSSTSIIGIAAVIFALGLWPLRGKMRLIRWGILISLVGLHMIMKAPVWALIARIDLTGGSSGYHRFELIDQAIRHFGEWWLIGTRAQSQWGWGMWDSINWYVAEGASGGLITMILFIAVIVYCFKRIGAARKAAETAGDRGRELFLWALGATLFANAVSFIGIVYYGQAIVLWLTLLAIISTATTIPTVSTEVETQNAFVPLGPEFAMEYRE
jgi:hypothetical protein